MSLTLILLIEYKDVKDDKDNAQFMKAIAKKDDYISSDIMAKVAEKMDIDYVAINQVVCVSCNNMENGSKHANGEQIYYIRVKKYVYFTSVKISGYSFKDSSIGDYRSTILRVDKFSEDKLPNETRMESKPHSVETKCLRGVTQEGGCIDI